MLCPDTPPVDTTLAVWADAVKELVIIIHLRRKERTKFKPQRHRIMSLVIRFLPQIPVFFKYDQIKKKIPEQGSLFLKQKINSAFRVLNDKKPNFKPM